MTHWAQRRSSAFSAIKNALTAPAFWPFTSGRNTVMDVCVPGHRPSDPVMDHIQLLYSPQENQAKTGRRRAHATSNRDCCCLRKELEHRRPMSNQPEISRHNIRIRKGAVRNKGRSPSPRGPA